jgi:hypothetical protein
MSAGRYRIDARDACGGGGKGGGSVRSGESKTYTVVNAGSGAMLNDAVQRLL